MIPSGIPYDPSDGTAIDYHSPLVPETQSLMCSIAALAAEAALDNFLALMIAAPLY
jgi:hypothetical protein